jgi:hypothetical protein
MMTELGSSESVLRTLENILRMLRIDVASVWKMDNAATGDGMRIQECKEG